MVAAHDLPQVHCEISKFVVHDPAQVHEGRRIPDDPLALAHCTVPVQGLGVFVGQLK